MRGRGAFLSSDTKDSRSGAALTSSCAAANTGPGLQPLEGVLQHGGAEVGDGDAAPLAGAPLHALAENGSRFGISRTAA